MGGVEEGEQDAAQGGFAAGRIVPLGEGVDAVASAAGGQCRGGNVEGEREIGVGGAEAELGAEVEVPIDGAQGVKERGVGRQGGGGAVADVLDLQGDGRVVADVAVGHGDELLEGAVKIEGEGVELGGVGGTEVERDGGRVRNGVDGRSAGNLAGAEGGSGVFFAVEDGGVGGEDGESLGDDGDGVGGGAIDPGVAARAGEGDAKTPAAKGSGDGGGGA